MLDPVRFITNLSTGEMGYAIAREARRQGLQVTLVSGPTFLKRPQGIRFVPIVSVEDLERALGKYFSRHDALVMSAAVGDFVPVRRALKKIPRKKTWKVVFRQTPDLIRKLAARKGNRIVIGFSLETGNWLARSRKKLFRKHLDGIVANYFSPGHSPFGKTRVHVALIDSKKTQVLHRGSKSELAKRLLSWMMALG